MEKKETAPANPADNQKPRELEWLHATITPAEKLARADDAGDDDNDEDEDFSADVQWYTGACVPRMDYYTGEKYMLTLGMEEGQCSLARLNNGAPLLNNHSSYSLSDVIGVIEPGSAKIQNGMGTARVRFSMRPDVKGIRDDVKNGIIRNVSVGASIRKLKDITPEDSKMKSYLATDWEPMEISAVPIPADAAAGFLSHQVIEPVNETQFRAEAQNPQEQTQLETITNTGAEDQARLEAVRLEAVKAERKRVADIQAAVAAAKLSADFAAELVSCGASVDEARAQVLAKLAAQTTQNPTQSANGGAHVTVDVTEKMCAGIENAILHRHNPTAHKLEEGREYFGLSLIEMGRELLAAKGIRTRGLSRVNLASLLLTPSSSTTGYVQFAAGYGGTTDYPNILANVANKTLRAAYDAEPQTFKPWSKRSTIMDFKPVNRTQIGDIPTLQSVGASGEIKYVNVGDAKETYSLGTYANIIPVNRQALINDDLNAFTRLPESMGRAGARLESDVVYGILTTNAAMGDSNNLFSTAHGNYVGSGSGGAIAIATLGAARTAMRKQTGLNSIGYLNLDPKFLVVPVALETTAQQFVAQTNIIYTKASDFNPFAGTLQVIPEPRLDVANAGAWYLMTDPGRIDTVEYAYLEGQEGMYMETRMGFDVDGMELKARLDFAAKAIDWRGMYFNYGS
jgi:hypothetical protein